MLFELTPPRSGVGAGFSPQSYVSMMAPGASTILASPMDADEASPSSDPRIATRDVPFADYVAQNSENHSHRRWSGVGVPGVTGPSRGTVLEDADYDGAIVIVDSASVAKEGAALQRLMDSEMSGGAPQHSPLYAQRHYVAVEKNVAEQVTSPLPLSVTNASTIGSVSALTAGGPLPPPPPMQQQQTTLPPRVTVRQQATFQDPHDQPSSINFYSVSDPLTSSDAALGFTSPTQGQRPFASSDARRQVIPSQELSTSSPFGVSPVPRGDGAAGGANLFHGTTASSSPTNSNINDIRHQRSILQQIARELAVRQQEAVRKELDLQRREASLQQREQEVSDGLQRLAQERAKDAEIQSEKSRLESTRDDPLKQELQQHREQLRQLHKELNSRELEIDQLARELMKERELVAKAKLQLDAREAAISAQQEDHSTDTRRHVEVIRQSSRVLDEKLRVAEQRERDAEKLHYEWELRTAEVQRREAELRGVELQISQRERDLATIFEMARSLELQATQVRRAQERIEDREQLLWESAAKASGLSSDGIRTVAAVMEGLKGTMLTLDGLAQQLPQMSALSAV